MIKVPYNRKKHFKELPVIFTILPEMVLKNYYRIRKEIEELIETKDRDCERPEKERLLVG